MRVGLCQACRRGSGGRGIKQGGGILNWPTSSAGQFVSDSINESFYACFTIRFPILYAFHLNSKLCFFSCEKQTLQPMFGIKVFAGPKYKRFVYSDTVCLLPLSVCCVNKGYTGTLSVWHIPACGISLPWPCLLIQN